MAINVVFPIGNNYLRGDNMENPYISTAVPTGTKMDEWIQFLSMQYESNREPVGVVIDNMSSSPLVTRIDKNEEPFTPGYDFFNNHELFQFLKCTLTPAGTPTFGELPNGYNYDGTTDLDFTGVSGDLMVRIQNPQVRYRYEEENDTQIIQYAPFDSGHTYFDYHPHAYAGGKLNKYFYLASKEAYGYLDPIDSKFKLGSATGKQPITGEVSYTDCPHNGRFTIDDALTYASNKGTGWTITDVHCLSLLQELFYTWAGTRDSQSKLGLGIVNLEAGVGFAGKNTGADSIDSTTQIDIWGTGAGTGTNGETPVSWLGLENLWGNVVEYITGINMFQSDGYDVEGKPFTAGSCRIINKNWTGPLTGTLAYGSYETCAGTVPLANGYISLIHPDQLGALAGITQTVGDERSGSDLAYCDFYYYPRNNPSTMMSSGNWFDDTNAGINCRYCNYAPTNSYRTFGARLQFIPS